MNAADCEFVMVGGYWLPAVADLSRTPVYVGDYDRAYSGVLRTAHVGKARKWRVLLAGVASEDVPMVEEILRSPEPVACNVMGEECIASVTEISSAHVPVRRGPNQDWGRMNYEIEIEETWAEHVLPGYTYQYMAFLDTGSFVWDWDAAGQPDVVDVLLIGGGGGSATAAALSDFGVGGGGAGGVAIALDVNVTGNVSGSVGAGGAPGANGQNTTFGSLTAVGGGRGGGTVAAGDGGSGGGSKASASPGSGTPGQGSTGGQGSNATGPGPNRQSTQYGGGGGGGGAGGVGRPGSAPNRARGAGGAGGPGVDLLSLGWNYRLTAGVPRFVGGGGGGGTGGFERSSTATRPAPAAGGIGGGGRGGGVGSDRNGHDGTPNTGGGGGAPAANGAASSGGSGLVIVRWLVN